VRILSQSDQPYRLFEVRNPATGETTDIPVGVGPEISNLGNYDDPIRSLERKTRWQRLRRALCAKIWIEPVRVLIIGASKGIGLETARQALAAGHDVRALSRSAAAIGLSHPRLEKVRGDALKSQNVKTALIGVEVVIQTLGVGLGELFQPVHLFSDATRVLIDAMTTQGVKRLICVTGFGAGDSRASIPWLQRLPFEAVFGRAYADKSLQERLIRQSELDWTIARPGILTNGPRTGRFKILTEATQWRNGIISRADVADFLVSQIEDRTYVHKAPVLVS
jgi:putative NADH-flavin reductase